MLRTASPRLFAVKTLVHFHNNRYYIIHHERENSEFEMKQVGLKTSSQIKVSEIFHKKERLLLLAN